MGRTRIVVVYLAAALFAISLACGSSPAPATPTASPTAQSPQPGLAPPLPILIGTEYIVIENAARVRKLAGMLAPIGLAAAKPLPENFQWNNMQPNAGAPLDFSRLDSFVREFQAAGFTELVLALRSSSAWASKSAAGLFVTNPVPKPEYMDAYEAWVFAVVERYDGDGVDDLPGLLFPVRIYEIGSEFSSYEPEPVEEYLAVLERAYAAAHRADEDVIVTHAAFLTTLAFENNPGFAELEQAFRAVPDQTHTLADLRKVLDRPDLFDVANVHALGASAELEAIAAWLNEEMARRGYHKPIMISDTATTPFIAWGPATTCEREPGWMGHIIPPATEEDRCRLADYFGRLVAGDEATVQWVQGFSAADMVKKVVVAAEQGYFLIDTAFTEDLFWLKLAIAQAGAGNSAWAGLVDVERQEYRPGFYALQQLLRHLRGYQAITRLPFAEEGVRVYEITREDGRVWVAWYEPDFLVLPGDPIPERSVTLQVEAPAAILEPVIALAGQAAPAPTTVQTPGGALPLALSPTPVFVTLER